MAASSFPQRKSSGAGGMTSPGASQLDGPPPSPAMGAGGPMQPGAMQGQMPSFSEMAEPLTAGTPGRAVPPEIAVGLMQTATTVYGILDSMASIAPDLANEFAMQKDLLQRTMAKLVTNSGSIQPPSALGTNFPGGGFATGLR